MLSLAPYGPESSKTAYGLLSLRIRPSRCTEVGGRVAHSVLRVSWQEGQWSVLTCLW